MITSHKCTDRIKITLTFYFPGKVDIISNAWIFFRILLSCFSFYFIYFILFYFILFDLTLTFLILQLNSCTNKLLCQKYSTLIQQIHYV